MGKLSWGCLESVVTVLVLCMLSLRTEVEYDARRVCLEFKRKMKTSDLNLRNVNIAKVILRRSILKFLSFLIYAFC